MDSANQGNLFQYNKDLKSFAKYNRNNMTKAEVCLWKFVIGNKQMLGYQFRRQRPVLNYIADFLCKELMLIIEVDGLTHLSQEVSDKDDIREKELATIGFKVLRFSDIEVLNDIQNVSRVIEFFIKDFQEKTEPSIAPPEGDS